MQFASLFYWYFFLLVATLLWAGSKLNNRWYRNGLLLIVSYTFYGFVSTDALILLIFSTTFNHVLSESLVGARPEKRRQWMWAGVGFNIGLLGVFKYLDFFRAAMAAQC